MAIECLYITRNTDMVLVWDSSKPDKLTGGPDGVRRQPLRWFLSGIFYLFVPHLPWGPMQPPPGEEVCWNN